MNDLTKLVLDYFKQIAAIPRQSGNEQGMQNYLVDYARKHNLRFYQDKHHNVIIYKKTADIEPIILQAHTDMVYVTKNNHFCAKQRKGVKLVKKNHWLFAKDTSLGADDGIGVALILALLDADIPCNIEAVFTASEETTMDGVYHIDVSKLKGKKLICLDGFESNAIVISSASFTDFLVKFNAQMQLLESDYNWFRITLKGLLGGHSGFDIDKARGNSHQLISDLLQHIPDAVLNRMIGGYQFNVIPSESTVVFATKSDEETVDTIVKAFINDHAETYPTLEIDTLKIEKTQQGLKQSENILNFIKEFQYGVLLKDKEDNVLISQNLSEINTEKGTIKIGVRSNIKEKESEILKDLQNLCNKHHLDYEIEDTQPGFATLLKSSLLEDLQSANPLAKKIKMHIAVECGVFQKRIENLDTVIISPTILCAHSIQERLNLDSVELTANWLEKFLTLN